MVTQLNLSLNFFWLEETWLKSTSFFTPILLQKNFFSVNLAQNICLCRLHRQVRKVIFFCGGGSWKTVGGYKLIPFFIWCGGTCETLVHNLSHSKEAGRSLKIDVSSKVRPTISLRGRNIIDLGGLSRLRRRRRNRSRETEKKTGHRPEKRLAHWMTKE